MLFEEDKAAHEAFDACFAKTNPDEILESVVTVVARLVKAHRCFLLTRQPDDRLYRVFCWRAEASMLDMTQATWAVEDNWEVDDNLFRVALTCAPPFFIDDITKSPDVNQEFEAKFLGGHKALIHAHIHNHGKLFGVLQPCVFDGPRAWSAYDKAVILYAVERLLPVVEAFIKTARKPVVETKCDDCLESYKAGTDLCRCLQAKQIAAKANREAHGDTQPAKAAGESGALGGKEQCEDCWGEYNKGTNLRLHGCPCVKAKLEAAFAEPVASRKRAASSELQPVEA
jgi:hypothetical protein